MNKKSTLQLLFGLVLAFTAFVSAQDLTYTFENGVLTGSEFLSVNGYQHFLFVNNSDVEVEMSLLRLHEGVTLEEVLAAEKAIDEAFISGGDAGKALADFVSLADAVGGVTVAPMSQGSAYLLLEPGHYGVGAISRDEDGAEDYMLLSVSEGERAEAPMADFSLSMGDFHLNFPAIMNAGPQMWHISSTGQPHMALIFKLSEGATADDVLGFIMSEGEPGGPPPFESGTVISPITSGQSFFTSVNLSPGNYAAICPLPDFAGGEKTHADHGMVASFKVQ